MAEAKNFIFSEKIVFSFPWLVAVRLSTVRVLTFKSIFKTP